RRDRQAQGRPGLPRQHHRHGPRGGRAAGGALLPAGAQAEEEEEQHLGRRELINLTARRARVARRSKRTTACPIPCRSPLAPGRSTSAASPCPVPSASTVRTLPPPPA